MCLCVHLVEAGFAHRRELRDVQFFLVYLFRRCLEKNGRLNLKKGFGGRNCLRALVFLGEERARRYPFVASQAPEQADGNMLPEEAPMFYELSIESLLRLTGVSTQHAQTAGLMPVVGEKWSSLIGRYKASEERRFRLFGDLLDRYFGGNETLLARRVPMEPNVSIL